MIKYINSHKKDNQLTYYWYHHMIPNELRECISKIINKHDFYSFVFLKNLLERNDLVCYLPEHAYVAVDGIEEYQQVNIMNEEDFSRIYYEECECG